MAEPEMGLWQQLITGLGLFASGLFGKQGFDSARRRRNGFKPPPGCPASSEGVSQIVGAINAEGDATRKVHYETAKEQSTHLNAVSKELAIIKDRLGSRQ